MEEKVFNVSNDWECEVLFFHAYISEQIIFNWMLPKHHFSKSNNRQSLTTLNIIVLKVLFFVHIQKMQFYMGLYSNTDF